MSFGPRTNVARLATVLHQMGRLMCGDAKGRMVLSE
jgi:hypothetical protein